mgnify:CR=1 FL=1
MNQRFNIGDRVYLAAFDRKAIAVTCPDCFGFLRLRVILCDNTDVSIDWVGCASGYDRPKGYITNYEWTASAKQCTVTEVTEKMEDEKIQYEYHFAGGYCDYDGKTFATEEEALTKANELRQAHEDDENRQLMAKTKDKRSWAWNVHYHRQCADRAQRDLAYHESKAQICAAKVKHEKS